jgi:cytochrome c oxidase assembly factor CtaG
VTLRTRYTAAASRPSEAERAAPLLLLGTPLWPFWRAIPLPVRRVSLRWALTRRWLRHVWRAMGRIVLAPVPALALFMVVFSVWRIPPLYDLALERPGVHALEHATFLASALLMWAQVIPSRPIHPRLSLIGRILYLGGLGMYSNLLGSLFVFSTGPFYPYYANLPRSSGMIDVLVDQHLGGAAMDVPGTIIFFVAMWTCLLTWLREDEQQGAVERLYASSGAAVATQPVTSGEPPERVAIHLCE